MQRRGFLKCIGLAPIAIGAVACEADRRARPTDARPDSSAPDTGSASDTGASPDAALDDAGFQDAGVADAGHEHPSSCSSTGADLEGPFYRSGAPSRTVLVAQDEPGQRLAITGNVLDADCTTPIRGVLLDVWHADAAGRYDNTSTDYRLRGVLTSDEQGAFAFDTIRPGNYPDAGGMRPAHIHFTVIHPDYQPLTTQLYFAGDPFLSPNDSCATCNSEDPTLILELEPQTRDGVEWLVGHFDIVLRPA